jgi:hypothetical protein
MRIKIVDTSIDTHIVVDNYFGEISVISQPSDAIKKIATEYFGRDVDIDMYSFKTDRLQDIYTGFVSIDEFRIPFEYVYEKTRKQTIMDISLYYSVVYSRDAQFNDDNYHHINTTIKNVLRDKVDDYTVDLLAVLPGEDSIRLNEVLKDLYFYPHIDHKNSKHFRVTIDLIRKNMTFDMTHYQRHSALFNAVMTFYYDGEIFSLHSANFSSLPVKNIKIDDCWKYFMAEYFRQPDLIELLDGKYTSMNDLLTSLEKAILVLNMKNI